jgi:hypothetical protein
MNIIKKTALTCLAISLTAFSAMSFAEEAATAAAPSSIAETISHAEAALSAVEKSDFSAARLHFKAARAASEKITGHEAAAKQANDSLVKGQISSGSGDGTTAAAELKKSISLYKSM